MHLSVVAVNVRKVVRFLLWEEKKTATPKSLRVDPPHKAPQANWVKHLKYLRSIQRYSTGLSTQGLVGWCIVTTFSGVAKWESVLNTQQWEPYTHCISIKSLGNIVGFNMGDSWQTFILTLGNFISPGCGNGNNLKRKEQTISPLESTKLPQRNERETVIST